MIDISPIYTYNFFHPQQNLSSSRKDRAKPEDEFAGCFAHAYKVKVLSTNDQTSRQKTIFIREMPIENHGIADLIVVKCNQTLPVGSSIDTNILEGAPTIRAFEIKIADWRGGLMQAHRYKYFSHTSILVLPKKKLEVAKRNIELFKTLRVGLWGFDSQSDSVIRVYTPRPKKPPVSKYSDLVIKNTLKTASLQPCTANNLLYSVT